MITVANPYEPDAIRLLEELSDALEAITGDSGKSSFNLGDVCQPRSLFVIARGDDGHAIGCGAIRPLSQDVAEVKRMYAKIKAAGIGGEILSYLEDRARALRYSAPWLETRAVNKNAVAFYENRGYHRIPNYGKYIGHPEAVCFEKSLMNHSKG